VIVEVAAAEECVVVVVDAEDAAVEVEVAWRPISWLPSALPPTLQEAPQPLLAGDVDSAVTEVGAASEEAAADSQTKPKRDLRKRPPD
jgi:hypothetical protein